MALGDNGSLAFSGYQRAEDGRPDAFLTQTGPRTPGGEYLRRFWQPIAMLEDINDLPVVRRVMCEDLVAFRDKGGRYGVVHLHCSHRGTSLEFGQIEERGIRCCYHGRLYDIDGTILEAPGEPVDQLRRAVAQGAYPTHVFAGMLFVYMGPPGKRPPFPNYDRFNLPGVRIEPNCALPFACNWVQVKENVMDPIHTATLHVLPGQPNPFGDGFGVIPELEFIETPVGGAYLAVRRVGDNVWTRSTDVLMPNIHSITSVFENGKTRKEAAPPWMTLWTTPVDDESCINFTIMHLTGNETREQRIAAAFNNFGQTPNRPYEDRQRVPGDYDAMTSQGPITKHSKENLGVGDIGVAMFRRLLRRSIEAVQRGEDPPAHYRVDGQPTRTYGNDRIVPASQVDGNPDDPAALKQYAKHIAKDYLAHPPLESLL
jgi:phenylpropionate dioxygenase-like ring-hydroxylating dioxygenase large terminal subunit